MNESLAQDHAEPRVELPEGWVMVKGRDTVLNPQTWEGLLSKIGPTTRRPNVAEAASLYKAPVFGGLTRVRYIKPFAPTAGSEALEWARAQSLFPASLYHVGADLEAHAAATGREGLNDRFTTSSGGILTSDALQFNGGLCAYALGWNMTRRRQSIEFVSFETAYQTWHAFVCDAWEKQP